MTTRVFAKARPLLAKLGLTLVSLYLFCTVSAFASNDRFAWDLSARAGQLENQSSTAYWLFAGFDYHRVFSSTHSDVGTFLFQPYVVHISNLEKHPGFFDDATDTQVTLRNAYFNFSGNGRALPNLKIGHFELPYGLEFDYDTNGKLYDYGIGKNLGNKVDWGLTLNDQTSYFAYEVALSNGSGQKFTTTNNQIITGHIQSYDINSWRLGASYTHKDIENQSQYAYGINVSYVFNRFDFRSEINGFGGKTNKDINSLFELRYFSNDEQTEYFTQFTHDVYQELSLDPKKDKKEQVVVLGIETKINRSWSLAARLDQSMNTESKKNLRNKFLMQLRWRSQ